MELKQLEFFLAVIDYGSLGKAASRLYTSQPNVSKVIHNLESELGKPLFERTTKGLRLNDYGKSIYEYAKNTIQNANLIKQSVLKDTPLTLSVSTYQSNMLSKIITSLYLGNTNLHIDHHKGTVEEIISHVEQGLSELGILFLSRKHFSVFNNILTQKKLCYVEISRQKACLYVGPNSPLYQKNSIHFSELTSLKYVRSYHDFFAMEDGLKQVSLGLLNPDDLKPVVSTNSEQFMINLLLNTDLVDIGIDLYDYDLKQFDIKNIQIEGEDSILTLGYIMSEDHILSSEAAILLQELIKSIHND